MKKLSFLLCAFLFTTLAMAQDSYRLSGTVHGSGDVMAFANIYVKGAKKGAVSDINGRYSIESLSPGTYTVIASFTGHKSETKTVTIMSADAQLDFELFESFQSSKHLSQSMHLRNPTDILI